MFKKTFYTVLAVGAVITLSMISSGFTNATHPAEASTAAIAAEAEVPFAGTWYIGTIAANGSKKDTGTGEWYVNKRGVGHYEIYFRPGVGGPMVVSVISPNGSFDAYNPSLNNTLSVTVEHSGVSSYQIYIHDESDKMKDSEFSFMMYAK